MSKNQFEQLIEYVINDEDAKAKELFHQIVVSKSRQIYENLMQEDDMSPEMNAMGDMQGQSSEMEEGDDMEEGHHMMGGSKTRSLMRDVEMEETGMHEAEDDEDDMDGDDMDMDGDDMDGDDMDGDDMDGEEPASKSDVMDLADKLDELMADFENMMGGGDMGDDAGMGDDGMDDEEVDFDEIGTEGMMENISLKQVHPKVTTHEQGDGKAGPVAFNAGQTGMEGRPVRAGKNEGGNHDTAAYKNSTKDLIGKVGNSPAQGTQNLKPATKPHLGQASGVNTRTPFPRSGK
jgi:hypothetical protein